MRYIFFFGFLIFLLFTCSCDKNIKKKKNPKRIVIREDNERNETIRQKYFIFIVEKMHTLFIYRAVVFELFPFVDSRTLSRLGLEFIDKQ